MILKMIAVLICLAIGVVAGKRNDGEHSNFSVGLPSFSGEWMRRIEDGDMTSDCSNYNVTGTPSWWSSWPSETHVYGPRLSKIKGLLVNRVWTRHPNGIVRLLAGGVDHHYALLSFKTSKKNEGYSFKVEVCW